MSYVPGARIYHKVSKTLGTQSPTRWKHQGKNTVLFYRKDGRFGWWALGTFLVWFTIREIINGHARILPAFWSGVSSGLSVIQRN